MNKIGFFDGELHTRDGRIAGKTRTTRQPLQTPVRALAVDGDPVLFELVDGKYGGRVDVVDDPLTPVGGGQIPDKRRFRQIFSFGK
jgi:hypothetical protein